MDPSAHSMNGEDPYNKVVKDKIAAIMRLSPNVGWLRNGMLISK